MRAAARRLACSQAVLLQVPASRLPTIYRNHPLRHSCFTAETPAPSYLHKAPAQAPFLRDAEPIVLQDSTLQSEEESEGDKDDAMSTSTGSSSMKRKRGAPAFYAVKAGHQPGLYYSWEDTKQQTAGYKNAVFKKFNTLAEAEDFLKGDSNAAPKPGKFKYYGVQAGHKPGVYTDWPSVLEQVTGFKGGKQKSFATWEEAQAYVNEGSGATPSDPGSHLSLKAQLESMISSVEDPRKGSKKQKKNDGSIAFPETNGHFEPGTGPLPPGAEDGFDRTIKLTSEGTIRHKTTAELEARKMQPTGDFEGPLQIYTDGAAKGNGKIGAFAGVGVWFGANDPRNVSEPLIGDGKQTNQRAELTAIARAMDIAPIDRSVMIYTDSYYSIKCLTEWFQKWESNEWKSSSGKPVENKDLIEPLITRIREREMAKASTKFTWVKGHANNEGNIGADHLASQGAMKGQINVRHKSASGNEAAHALAQGGAETSQAIVNAVLEDQITSKYWDTG